MVNVTIYSIHGSYGYGSFFSAFLCLKNMFIIVVVFFVYVRKAFFKQMVSIVCLMMVL